jgi:hypothetical protein
MCILILKGNKLTIADMTKKVARIVEMRYTYKILVDKPEGKGALGRRRRRWADNMIRDFKVRGGEDVESDACGPGQGPMAGS